MGDSTAGQAAHQGRAKYIVKASARMTTSKAIAYSEWIMAWLRAGLSSSTPCTSCRITSA